MIGLAMGAFVAVAAPYDLMPVNASVFIRGSTVISLTENHVGNEFAAL